MFCIFVILLPGVESSWVVMAWLILLLWRKALAGYRRGNDGSGLIPLFSRLNVTIDAAGTRGCELPLRGLVCITAVCLARLSGAAWVCSGTLGLNETLRVRFLG